VTSLARALGVSEMTIRRDFDLFEKRGLIRRTHGGALAQGESQIELDYRVRLAQNANAKRQIARCAAGLVAANDAVFLDAGTTVLAMVPFLERRPITVVTHSLSVFEALRGHEEVRLIVLGGEPRRDLMCFVGPVTQQTLATLRVQWSFLGTGGIDADRGLTHSNLEEVPLKRAAAAIADKVAVLADSTKFGRAGVMHFMPLSEIDLVITDADCAPEKVRQLRKVGVEVEVRPTHTSPGADSTKAARRSHNTV
jgi:DeoR/GlpR family transcriptional regulator of sugar metabolism